MPSNLRKVLLAIAALLLALGAGIAALVTDASDPAVDAPPVVEDDSGDTDVPPAPPAATPAP